MIDISDYWTLPPSLQRMTRTEVAHFEQELQRVVGYYHILCETHKYIEFILLCSRCCHVTHAWDDADVGYTPLTKGEYLDRNHDMHGENCERCKKRLV